MGGVVVVFVKFKDWFKSIIFFGKNGSFQDPLFLCLDHLK